MFDYELTDKDAVKRDLPLHFAAKQLGIDVHNDAALCPFHQDTSPSFRLYVSDDGVERWHCFPCGAGGDVFDLIARIDRCSFPEAVQHAAEMLARLPEGYERPAPAPPAPPADFASVLSHTEEDEHGYVAVAARFCPHPETDAELARARRISAFLQKRHGWRLLPDGTVAVPHYSPDGRSVTGVKLRRADGSKHAVPGSKFESMYGAHLRPPRTPVLLTEGETDAVWADGRARGQKLDLAVMSLPTGAGSPPTPQRLAQLKDAPVVYLCFDGDDAGVQATNRWLTALRDAGFQDVRVCPLPYGRDLRDARPDLRQMLANAAPPPLPPDALTGGRDGFMWTGPRSQRQLTTWHIRPYARLIPGDGSGAAYGCDVYLETGAQPKRDHVTVDDMISGARFRKWCAARGLEWLGSDSDTYLLQSLMRSRADALPRVFATQRVGMHEPPADFPGSGRAFVVPRHSVGRVAWRYAPVTVKHAEGVMLPPPPGAKLSFSPIGAFLDLNDRSVTEPVLAWLFAAARRIEVENFPILFVSGSSGCGKSTLVAAGCEMMGSAIGADLGQVTPFALMTTLACSTTLPVFVDEWSRQSRRDALDTFQGTLPVIYRGGVAERGQADLSVVRYRLQSPVVVAGEDAFDLDRATERMVRVTPPRAGRNPAQLQRLNSMDIETVGWAAHGWLATEPDLPPLAHEDAPDRVTYNRSVLLGGWQTLLAFCDVHFPLHDLPSLPDLSSLDEQRLQDENSYEVALAEALSMRDRNGNRLVWEDPEGRGVWCRFAPLVTQIKQTTDVELPGGYRAMKAYFQERHRLIDGRPTLPMTGESVRATLIEGLKLETEPVDADL